MLSNEKANMYLYVPFNHEYSVPVELQLKLTMKEFFENCYYDPEFDKVILELKTLTNEGEMNFEYPISVEQAIQKVQQQKNQRDLLLNWITNNDVGIYCVTGDAGTGKSTFLNHLKYNEYDNAVWKFLDLQSAITPIKVMNNLIKFLSFERLHQKLISTIIFDIIQSLFIKKVDNRHIDFLGTKNTILKFINCFTENFEELYPSNEVSEFFMLLATVDSELADKEFCLKCAQIVYDYFSDLSSDIKNENNSFSQ
ncbi:MAG: hypothetical protein E7384_07120 [Ruminococcaceae bacterium]|nr:hypothetical protein [Oscillospiraceae bacterium]